MTALDPHERTVAFDVYASAYSGATFPYPLPADPLVLPGIIAAAILAGTADRGGEPASRADVAAYVEEALSESREGPEAGEVAEPPDATAAALAAYAEGVGDTLDKLETWMNELGTVVRDHSLCSWLSARRAAAPRRPMSAGEVLDRIDTWTDDSADGRNLAAFLADLRREIAAR